ncbi:hypothetical protein LCGC14_0838050 [marine sediment metagenome]|uniref:Uncharacterized protein n=1 Tax=marine sediment metagenome TaxID=412755 RepID=A0A0F9PZ70_9ZZZZ
MSVLATAPVDSSFFSNVSSIFQGAGEGLAFTGREILPRFFAQELLDQSSDPLRNPTFIRDAAGRTLDQGQESTGAAIPKKAFLDFTSGGVNVSGTTLIVIAGAIIAFVVIINAMRRSS